MVWCTQHDCAPIQYHSERFTGIPVFKGKVIHSLLSDFVNKSHTHYSSQAFSYGSLVHPSQSHSFIYRKAIDEDGGLILSDKPILIVIDCSTCQADSPGVPIIPIQPVLDFASTRHARTIFL